MAVVILLCSDTVLRSACALRLDTVERQCRNNAGVPREASSSHEQCCGCPMVGE